MEWWLSIDDLTCDDSENFDDAVMDDNGALKKLENEFLASDSFVTQPPSLEGSLFSEVHMNEIKKFERLLEEADSQKHHLTGYKNELTTLRGSIEEYAKKTKCYEGDHGTLSTMLSEFYTHYNQTFEELSLVSEELASLYHHLCLSMFASYCSHLT